MFALHRKGKTHENQTVNEEYCLEFLKWLRKRWSRLSPLKRQSIYSSIAEILNTNLILQTKLLAANSLLKLTFYQFEKSPKWKKIKEMNRNSKWIPKVKRLLEKVVIFKGKYFKQVIIAIDLNFFFRYSQGRVFFNRKKVS